MQGNRTRRLWAALTLGVAGHTAAWAGYFPVFDTWPQPDGPGSALTLTYSFSNLLDGSLRTIGGTPLPAATLRAAFETALQDYTLFLPIHFVEVEDRGGPLPETGRYDPTGLADIRIGQVAAIAGANAYAYYPSSPATNGLAGDIVFNAGRGGLGWTVSLFHAVAQHELGHVLGMGHYVTTGDLPAPYDGPVYPLEPEAVAALQAAYGAGRGSVTPLSAVPEPGPSALLLAGLAALAWRARQRRAP